MRYRVIHLLSCVAAATASLSSFSSTATAQESVQVLSFSAEGAAPGPDGSKGSIAIGGFGGPAMVIGGPGGLAGASITTDVSFGGGNPDNASSLVGLLNNDSIRSELKLSDEQLAGARKIIKMSSDRISERVRQALSDGRSPRDLGLKEVIAENQKATEVAIEEILLPQQLKRLRQLTYQVEIAQIGLGEAIVSGRLGNEIGVTDNQKQHLTDRAAQIEAEAKAEIAKIRAAAQAKLMAELSTEQRQKAGELLGNYFMFEEPTMAQKIRQNLKSIKEKQAAEQQKKAN